MTVADLIKLLKQQRQDAPVFLDVITPDAAVELSAVEGHDDFVNENDEYIGPVVVLST